MAKGEPSVSRKPVLLIGLGRGGAGKSTALAEVVWRARAGGRDPIIADGDMRSSTLGRLFPGEATRPPTEEMPDCKAWFGSSVLNRMVREKRSGVVDLGGGDRLLQEYGRDLRIVEFCARRGLEPCAVYFLGPDEEDLRHVLSLWKSGAFRPERNILVCNEGVIREGQTVLGAFKRTMDDPGFQEMVAEGAVPILMQRLACMDLVRKPGLGFYAAASGAGGLEPVEEFQTGDWADALETTRAQAGVGDWLP